MSGVMRTSVRCRFRCRMISCPASLSDVMSAICALGDSGGVSRQRGHHDPHECKQRQLPQDGMQLVVVGDVEDAEIRILPGYPPNVAPFARPLQLLAVGLL